MAYKVGYCIQCQTQIMVKDTSGQWSSCKGNYRQINLNFADGHLIRVPVCRKCCEAPNYTKIFDELKHDDSQATRKAHVKEIILKNKDGTLRQKPTSHQEVRVNINKG